MGTSPVGSLERSPTADEVAPPSALVPALVVVVAVLAGLGAIASGVEPTADVTVDAVLVGLLGGLVALAGASAPWWLLAVTAAAAAALAPSPVMFVVALAAAGAALASGSRGTQAWVPGPVLRSVSAALIVQVALRLDPGDGPGWTTLAAGVLLAVVLIGGGLRSARPVKVLLATAGVVAVLVGVAGAVGLVVAGLDARDELERGVDRVRDGLDAVRAGDLELAETSLGAGAGDLAAARSRLDRFLSRPAAVVPVLAQHRRAALGLLAEGERLAAVGADTAGTLDLDAFRLQGGTIAAARIAANERPLAELVTAVGAARKQLTDLRSTWLVDPLIDELDELDDELAGAEDDGTLAVTATRVLPALVGGSGERRYLVALTTPTEARGSGFMGNYAEVSLRDGQVRLVAFGRSTDLNAGGDPASRTLSGPPDYLERYAAYGARSQAAGAGAETVSTDFWQVLTASPHFPNVAQVMAELYPQSGGGAVDGVIALDPYALATLLRFVGPVTVPGVARTIDHRNAAEFLLKEQYEAFDEKQERVSALEVVAREVFNRLPELDLPPPREVGRLLSPLRSQGRILAWSPRPEEQSLIERVGLDGALPPAEGDVIVVSNTNASGNKIDLYLQRDLRYDVTIDRVAGTYRGELTIALTNEAPTSGLAYVLGNKLGDPFGSNRTIVDVFTTGMLQRAAIDDTDVGVAFSSEAGLNVATTYTTVLSGDRAVVTMTFSGSLDDGVYRLVVQPQALATPERLAVVIRSADGQPLVPEGSALTPRSDGSVAWSGDFLTPVAFTVH